MSWFPLCGAWVWAGVERSAALSLSVRIVTWLLVALAVLNWLRALVGPRVVVIVVLTIGAFVNLGLVALLRSRRRSGYIMTIALLVVFDAIGFATVPPAQAVVGGAANLLFLVLLVIGWRGYMRLSDTEAVAA